MKSNLPLAALCLATICLSVAGQPASVSPGVYRCVASKFRNGVLETLPRGSVTLGQDGRYAYRGFDKPSEGRWMQQAGAAELSGGYLDHGEVKPMADRPGRYFLVFPTNPDNRWTCSLDKR